MGLQDDARSYLISPVGARIDFFSRVLRKHLTVHTIVGGDFNCVSDPTLDVVSADPLAYSNGGGQGTKQGDGGSPAGGRTQGAVGK